MTLTLFLILTLTLALILNPNPAPQESETTVNLGLSVFLKDQSGPCAASWDQLGGTQWFRGAHCAWALLISQIQGCNPPNTPSCDILLAQGIVPHSQNNSSPSYRHPRILTKI